MSEQEKYLTVTTDTDFAAIYEKVVIENDLSILTPADRVLYYNKLCKSLGLNPITKPFEYIKLNGKLTLYARKEAAAQLRKIHQISIQITKVEQINGNLYVWARASLPDGRTDEDAGCVPASKDPNTVLKCITKAKRRVTLSICGLGMLDETEVASIPKSRAKPIFVFKYCPLCKEKTYNLELDQCEQCGKSMKEIQTEMKEGVDVE